MPWFLHRWSPEAGRTDVRDASLVGVAPTAAYLRRKPRLDPLLREYLQSCLDSPFSAIEIVHADAGRGMRLKDLFTGQEHAVAERSASAALRRDDIVIGQVARAGGLALLEAAPGFAIAPIDKIELLESRRRHFGRRSDVAPETRARRRAGADRALRRARRAAVQQEDARNPQHRRRCLLAAARGFRGALGAGRVRRAQAPRARPDRRRAPRGRR